jgi:vancomycin permeability regulator SanA
VAFSLCVGLGLVCIAYNCWRVHLTQRRSFDSGRIALLVLIWLGLFPLLQTLCFGKTDYRRPADVAVVFGARAYANGQPSDALADRVRTACHLYRQGIVRKLLFSGGPGDGPIHETEAMRLMAVSLGVSDSDILMDRAGLNTEQTVVNTTSMVSKMSARRVLAVSHFYHLPRIKMAYQRHGWEVYTVPAREKYFLKQIPYSMAREVAAFWEYYWHPLQPGRG